MQGLIECLSAFMACVGFAFIFRVHQNLHFAIIGSLGGALGYGKDGKTFLALTQSLRKTVIK